MIIRQPYIETATGKRHVKEIDIRLEDMRSIDSAEPTSTANLIATGHNCDIGMPAVVSPNDKLLTLLDTKRTSVPYRCYQTYLTKKWVPGESNAIEIADPGPKGLNLQVGHPVVILDTLVGENRAYGMVKGVKGRTIELEAVAVHADVDVFETFFAGSFVQNLGHRWWGYGLNPDEIGLAARLHQPEALPFLPQIVSGRVGVVVTLPINTGNIQCYDLYVRRRKFAAIEPHWLPDVADVDIGTEEMWATTYNGGEECGGGPLTPGNYYVTIIAKDRLGRVNVNESAAKQVELVVVE